MYRWSNAENFGSGRLMVREKISSQKDRQTKKALKIRKERKKDTKRTGSLIKTILTTHAYP